VYEILHVDNFLPRISYLVALLEDCLVGRNMLSLAVHFFTLISRSEMFKMKEPFTWKVRTSMEFARYVVVSEVRFV
jgi:hypothetical protein